ncbi:RNA polymerase sigma factor [Labilithrix luteola]|uniref:RNA polymerase sigma factor n=1 Tax=Labilithrix luteola TaxID=1391654 RepID=UPI001473D81F|nr:sigma-70 family RNA polymerase sigma factor [Labilithrix luteola]
MSASIVTRPAAEAHPPESKHGTAALDHSRAEYLRGIVRAHFASVWRFLRRIGFEEDVVDDAAQELFFVALRRIDEAQPGRERAFLMGAAFRIASGLKRKAAREIPTEGLETDDTLEDNTPTLETRFDEERARALLYRLLSELEESLRVVFVMYELEGLTMQEIADVIDIPAGTVASRLRRAREEFDALLHRHRARQSRGRSL